MKKSVMAVLLIFTYFSIGSSWTHGEEGCYDLGYRYGMCATKSMQGIPCKPENDIVIPERCHGKEETKRGIKAGAKAVYDTLNLDTGSSK